MKIHSTLSKELETEFVPSKEVKVVDEEIENTVISVEAEDDYEKVRKTLHNLIETGNTAISNMHEIAQSDEQARSFEVLATLIKTVTETADKLLDSHEKKKKLIEPTNSKTKRIDTGVSIDKAVFVGTTDELLTKIQEIEKE